MIGSPSYRQRRSGVILVVVVSLLALFAVVGLGYVIYAETAATASRLQRDSQVYVDDRATIEPELILNRVLGALIYDHPDDQSGVYSALRGHSFARSMYGQREMLFVQDPFNPRGQPITINTNTVPFNGNGIVRVNEPTNVSGLSRPLSGLPRDQIVNYTYFNRLNLAERDPIIRVPEHYPFDPNAAKNYWTSLATLNPAGNLYFGGANAPYTYPDTNNMFLGAVRASDGQVLIPSFHRPYLFLDPSGNPDQTFLLNPTHPDWYRPSGRLKLLRPRPIDQVRLTDPRQQQIWAANGNPPFPPTENPPPTNAQLTQYSNATRAMINAGLIMPYPTDMGGDVKNLLGSPGGNDSIWIDTGLPVRLTKSGRKFKPLVAFLIVDLDGRINLNVHGNLRGQPGGNLAGVHLHASNQGFGRHEVNPMHVLTITTNEYQNLFQGFSGVPGRYTGSTVPYYPRPRIIVGTQQVDLSTYAASFLNPPNAADAVTGTQFQISAMSISAPTQLSSTMSVPNAQYEPPYMRIDFDGANEQLGRIRSESPYARAFSPATLLQQPLLLSSYPDYYTSSIPGAPAGYGNESSFPIQLNAMPTPQNDPSSELFQSAFLYNPLRNTGNSRQLDAMETHNMIARYNSPLDVGDSLLSKLLPQNLNPNNPSSAAIRHRITLVSADVGRAGLTPQTFQRIPGQPSAWGITAPLTVPFAQQGEQFPQLSTVSAPGSMTPPSPSDFVGNNIFVFAPGQQAPVQPNPGGSIVPIRDTMGNPISTFDGRAGIANLAGRIDLNRPLPPYPPLGITGANMTYSSAPATLAPQILKADSARQEFAKEIFERLMASVGAPSLNPPPTPGQPDYQALQYLAQLAVNIVDDIDDDDVSTVFHWNANSAMPQQTDFVFGVEMPKVVLNEAYFEQTNGPTMDPQYVQPANPPTQPTPKALKYQINVWAELNNTMVPPYVNPDPRYFQFRERHAMWLNNSAVNPLNGSPTTTSTYRMYLIKDGAQIPTVGDAQAGTSPDMMGMEKKVTFDSAMKKALYPVDTRVAAPGPSPHPCGYRCESGKDDVGFYVVGPDAMNPQTPATTQLGMQAATYKSNMMSYDERLEDTVPNPMPPQIVLQRLANPYIPLQPNPSQPFYNPYITVDVMKATPPMGNPQTLVGVMNKQIMYNKDGNAPAGGGTKKSVMRRQPFAGAYDRLVMSNGIMPMGDDVTMFRHNGKPDDAAMMTQLPEAGGTGLERFDWLVHHDRKLVSPMELIHVAAVAPWEVTQSFIRTDPTMPGQVIRQGHTAPWFDKYEKFDVMNPMQPYSGAKIPLVPSTPPNLPTGSTRLYRALEQFRVGDRTVEMAFGGRDLGKININTIWDPLTFRAMCDAWVDPSNPNALDNRRGFTQADVDYVWSALTDGTVNLTARSPFLNQTGLPVPYTQITGRDRPFYSAAAPHMAASQQYPPMPTGVANPPDIQNAGIQATIFRSFLPPDPMTSPFKRSMLFDAESQFNFSATNPPPAVQHPLMEKALLSKIYEHMTTRSNVFAVYMTVGYFEVLNDNEKPELLGDEIGILRDGQNGAIVENKAIRHRMFAIVDRTNLSLQPPRFVPNNANWEQLTQDVQRQGPAPFYYTAAITKTPASGLGAGAGGTPAMWRVELPITSFVGSAGAAASITGVYNGISWQIKPYDVLYVGAGSEQRRLVVWPQIQVVQNVAADGVTPILTALIRMAAPPLTGTTWPNMDDPPPHPELITNVIAGNPGPQPDFDHRMPNYRGVVLYSVIMD